jgi:hypothetical protein
MAESPKDPTIEKVEKRRPRWPRGRIVLAAAVGVVLIAASGVYGFLLHAHEFFPYAILKRGYHALLPHARHAMPKAKPSATRGSAAPDSIQRLANLPYLQGYRPATPGAAIRVDDRTRTAKGLNLFASGHAPVATLMDMEGTVVKTWTADAAKAFPGVALDHNEHARFLRRVHLLPDGSILALFDELGLVHLDPDSRILWAFQERTHHDLFVEENGKIWALARQLRVVPELRRDEPIWEDFIVELSPEGKLLRRISVIECFRKSSYAPLLANIGSQHDVLHTNTIRVLDGSLAGRSPLFRRGRLLLSLKNLNTVAVVDPDAGAVVWALSGQWYAQHSARFLPSGHLLLFDNLGLMRPASRILEIDLFTQKIVWSFGGRPGEEFLSETSGWVDRLPNGNTLITESNFGRVIEVTPDNQIVWEFVNPNRAGKKGDKVATIYEMERITRDLPSIRPPRAGSQAPPTRPAAP